MKRSGLLWAPWRSAFLYRSKRRGEPCIFCAAGRSTQPKRHRVIAEGRMTFALLNLYPYNNGHVMIAPRRHVGTIERLRPDEWAEIRILTTQVLARLQRALRPQGINLGINQGRVAGAGIPGHLHVHLVPRWQGDSNFMPVFSRVRVISQSLDELYTLLSREPRKRRR